MESLSNLWSREINAREEEVRLRLSGLWNSSEPQSEITYDDRVALLRWIHDLCLKEQEDSSDVKYKIPVMAVDILDRFLAVCKIKKSQLQLTGAVCVFLASKVLDGVRPISLTNLIGATDGSVKTDEIKEWELLVLTKLNWSLETVIPQDYFENIPSGTLNASVVINASLIIALSLLDQRFYQCHSRASIAFGALSLALKEDDQIYEIKSEFLHSVGLTQIKVDDTRKKLESIMWALLGTSSPKRLEMEDAPSSSISPSSSSTPKSMLLKRSPLKEMMGIRQRDARKRLQTDFDEESEFDDLNKENNDSAIGLNTSGLTEIPSSSSSAGSASSSAQSSPDSAASVKRTLRPSKSSAELDNVLKTTQIPPLIKKWET